MSATGQAPGTRSVAGGAPSTDAFWRGLSESMFELLPGAVYVCDMDGVIVWYNRRAAEIWGRSPRIGDRTEKFCGSLRLFLPDGSPLAHHETPTARVLESGEPVRDKEAVIEQPDGTRAVVLLNTEPLRDAAGRQIGAVTCFVDITGRRRAEQDLEERLMLAQEAGGVGTFERDFVAGTMQVSPNYWRLFGVEPEAFPRTYKGWLSRVHREDRARVVRELKQAFKLGRYEFEYRVVWPDGQTRWLQSRGRAEAAPDGKPLRLAGAIADLTDRKAAETALRRQEAELRRVTDAIPALVSYVDARRHFRLANRAYAEWFGRPRDEVEGRHVREVLGEAAYEAVRPAVEKTLRGEAARYEGRRIMPDGSERMVEASYVPRFGRDGRVIGFYAFVNDVTERNRTLAKLQAHTSLLATVLETVPAAVWVSEDPAGASIFGSRYAAQLFRKRPGDNLSRTPREGNAPADWRFCRDGVDLPLDVSPLRRALRGEMVRAEELDLVYDGGDRVTLLLSAAPLFDGDGKLTGAVSAGMDISERARTEAALRARTAELEAILETVPAAIWLARGSDAEKVEASRYAAALFRMDPGTARFKTAPQDQRPDHFRILMEGAEVADGELPLQRAARGEDVREEELELLFGDGSTVPVLINASPLRDEAGHIIGSVGAGIDIGERKRAEERQHLLMAELDHRVKNMLSTVMAIVARTARGRRSAADLVDTLNGRIMAMARAHERLAANSWEGVNLRALVEDELQPYALKERASFAGPDMILSAKAATALALVLHELATNAAKYGALSRDTGQVSIGWDCTGEPAEPSATLQLEWTETGGPPVAEPQTRGFGSTLIERTLAFEFDAGVALEWRSTGLHAAFSLPLAKVTAGRPA